MEYHLKLCQNTHTHTHTHTRKQEVRISFMVCIKFDIRHALKEARKKYFRACPHTLSSVIIHVLCYVLVK
jgi:hypothetical protein